MSKMKKSEARILIFLSNAENRHKYARFISTKLNLDYGYLIRILNGLKFFKVITPVKSGNKIFYQINKPDMLEKAMIRLGKL